MEPVSKTLELLFEQLGLPSDQAGIDAFIAEHYPLPDDVKLTEASFWSPGQAQMLREALASDDAWEPVSMNSMCYCTRTVTEPANRAER